MNDNNILNIDLDETCTYFIKNLETLSKLTNGDKLNLDNKTNLISIDEPFMFQGLWRYCNNISRKDAIYLISKLYNDIDLYINSQYLKEIEFNKKTLSKQQNISIKLSNIITLLIKNIKESLKGLDSLKITYESDNEILQELNKLSQKGLHIYETWKKII
jgi:hypothetical protein